MINRVLAWTRAPSLLVRFGLLTAISFMVFGVILTSLVGQIVADRSQTTAESTAELIARTAISAQIRQADFGEQLPSDAIRSLSEVIETEIRDGSVERFKLWVGNQAHAEVIWSNDPSAFGQTAEPRGPLATAFGGETGSKIVGGENDSHTNGISSGRLIEAFVPITVEDDGNESFVVAEVYLPYEQTATKLSDDRRLLSIVLLGGLAALFLVSFQIVARASNRLRRFARRSEYESRHDSLTGLPNRTLFVERINEAIDSARKRGGSVAVMFVDLDRFKDVNDTLGHEVGDQLLTDVAARLTAASRPSDTIARLGGDEFGLVLPDLATRGDAVTAAAKVLERLDPAFDLAGLNLDVGASIGVALYPDHGTDSSSLLRYADIAMYDAKKDGRTFVMYAGLDDAESTDGLRMLSELRPAITGGELILHFQPKVDLGTGGTTSVEALVRWEHPRHGLLAPDRFIPIAESAGLMRELTGAVLEMALAQLRSWLDDDLEMSIAVNISARNLNDLEFPALVQDALLKHGIAPERLELELTETALMVDQARALSVLSDLAALGTPLAIDDFGTGYSSLAYLQRLPIGVIKIDRSFITDVSSNTDNQTIVRSTISMARSLGLDVVAEGVETEDVRRQLIADGCHLAQGYYFARPMPAGDVAAWVNAHHPSAVPI